MRHTGFLYSCHNVLLHHPLKVSAPCGPGLEVLIFSSIFVTVVKASGVLSELLKTLKELTQQWETVALPFPVGGCWLSALVPQWFQALQDGNFLHCKKNAALSVTLSSHTPLPGSHTQLLCGAQSLGWFHPKGEQLMWLKKEGSGQWLKWLLCGSASHQYCPTLVTGYLFCLDSVLCDLH